VDGYLAGTVDNFDGIFQRLHVSPGSHELTLYLNGYQTVRQNVQLRVRQDVKVQFTMQPLAAGQTSEPPPVPEVSAEPPSEPPPPPPQPGRPRVPVETRPPAQGAPPREPMTARGFGSLVLRIQPAGSEVFIDGERWEGPEGQERLVVQVAAGAHHVEIRKQGYVTFTTDTRVESGETAPLNVSLPRVQ
jgi:hypothetical protein